MKRKDRGKNLGSDEVFAKEWYLLALVEEGIKGFVWMKILLRSKTMITSSR